MPGGWLRATGTCWLTTPHKLRIEARSRKRTGLHPVAPGAPQTDGRGRQLHAVVSQQEAPELALRDPRVCGRVTWRLVLVASVVHVGWRTLCSRENQLWTV